MGISNIKPWQIIFVDTLNRTLQQNHSSIYTVVIGWKSDHLGLEAGKVESVVNPRRQFG